jgi:lipopolysaccharide/colanic/teichoic acid biosynthesis glycosyltransferase
MTAATGVVAVRGAHPTAAAADSEIVGFLFDPAHLPSPAARRRKRALDLVLGTVLALLAAPVILLLALVSACALRTSPFFVQRRPGTGDSDFRIVKLRTLPKSFPHQAVKPELSGSPIPRFGAWLRRTHLDELPQLFEVVAGRMSLVGPRPRLSDDVERVDPGYDRLRRTVPPGCSGLWQISVVGDGTATGGPAYDLFYLRNVSVRLDLWILVRTMGQLLGLAPRVALGDVPASMQRHTRPAPLALPIYRVDPLLPVVTEDVA